MGFPIKTSSANKNMFGSVIDKVRNRLAGWQAKLLSMAGRAVVIKPTMEAIPAYQMSSLSMPRKVHEDIDRMNKNSFGIYR